VIAPQGEQSFLITFLQKSNACPARTHKKDNTVGTRQTKAVEGNLIPPF
jgi:hypothetical protein